MKQQRIAAGLEIKEVAHRIGKSYQYLRQLEEGVNEPPTWSMLTKLAEVYNCSVDSLLGLNREELRSIELDEEFFRLLKTVRALPKYRQRDLLAMAESFAARVKEDSREFEAALFDKIMRAGGKDAANLLLNLMDDLDKPDSGSGGSNGVESADK